LAASLSDVVPTILARPNPQVIYTGSAALAKSVDQHALRRRALELLAARGRGEDVDDNRFAYLEWGPSVSLVDGRVVTGPVDIDDVECHRRGNPGLGYRITMDKLKIARRALAGKPEVYLRENLGVWESPPEDTIDRPVKVPLAAWLRTGIGAREAVERWPRERVSSAGFAVGRDGSSSAIAIADGSLSSGCYVELVEFEKGVSRLAENVVRMLAANERMVMHCNGSGHSAGQVGAVMAAMAEAGVDASRLKVLGAGAYKAACEGFFTDVCPADGSSPRLQRPLQGQGPLDDAVGDAAERVLKGGFEWDQRNVTVAQSPLEAVTVARAGLPTLPEEKPVEYVALVLR